MTDAADPQEPTLLQTLDRLREAARPFFEEREAVWRREGPAARAALEATGAVLDQIGGNCPVQARGSVDGRRFYFRARGDTWSFGTGSDDDQAVEAPDFLLERDYGSWPEAGWMHRHEAVGFIVEAVAAYRDRKDRSGS